MARFTRNTSTFIQKKRHQLIEGGTIIERDWTTLGERHVIEPGKRRVYSDSGFLFTESTRPGTKNRTRTSEWSSAYTEDNLAPTVNDEVNKIKLPEGQDIRNYAYYGSAVELVRASLENIVKWFPGKAWTDGDYINNVQDDGEFYSLFEISDDGHHNYLLKFDNEKIINRDSLAGEVYEPHIWNIQNPFMLNFFVASMTNENELRNIPYSWGRYLLNGCKIISYDPWIKPYNSCDGDYTVLYDVKIRYEVGPSVSRFHEFYSDYGVDEDCITFREGLDENNCIVFLSSDVSYNEGHIYGLKKGDAVLWCTDIKGFTIMPVPNIITKYFDNLDGFERLLLTKKSNPIYSCTLKTPISRGMDEPGYTLVNRQYKFPSYGYCIICNSVAFNAYVTSLFNLANVMDEEFTDNIWRNMTHESIKNFDWTYRKDFEDDDAVENIFGGTRLKDVLRIYGRFFDDIKRYIDNIKLKNRVTFDGVNNLPVAELSDKAQLGGWEVYSTKIDNTSNLQLSSEFLNSYVTKQLSRWSQVENYSESIDLICDSQPVWFPGLSPDTMTQNDVDNYFMRMLSVNAPHIFRRKGTKHAIEMVYSLFGFGELDYTIEERYYSVTPRDAGDIVYAYRIMEEPIDVINYVDVDDVSGYISFTDYINSLPDGVNEESHPFITLNGIYYELIAYTFKELCEFINNNKAFVRNYEDDPYSGVPLGLVTINKRECVVPYFTQDKIYDGNVQFQTNGGWCKITDNDIDFDYNIKSNYHETLPYTQVLQNCSNLLDVNRYDIKGKNLYYVVDLSDITDYTEDNTSEMSHYFKIIDPTNPQLFSSWSNVPRPNGMCDYEYDSFCNEIFIEPGETHGYPLRPLYYGVTYNDYLESQYHENLIMDNLGNNPHTGLAKYDLGRDYINYLTAPFLYSEQFSGFSEEYLNVMAKMVRFEVKEYEGEKIVVNNNDSEYYLPSKVLIIKHKIHNEAFETYFKNVIIKYLTQVIPSTTILIFC